MSTRTAEPILYDNLQVEQTPKQKTWRSILGGRWLPVVAIGLFGVACLATGFGIAYAIVPRMGKYKNGNFPFSPPLEDVIAEYSRGFYCPLNLFPPVGWH